MTKDYAAPDWRGLCSRMADELDHYRQLLTDDRREAHPLADKARAALARWGHQPAPPAEGEVAELAAWLRGANWDHKRQSLATRAADLLAQRHPTPVPVSERLPGPEDCDAEGRCWFLRFPFDYSRESWSLEDRTYGCNTGFTHWLPATALPLPSGEVEA